MSMYGNVEYAGRGKSAGSSAGLVTLTSGGPRLNPLRMLPPPHHALGTVVAFT
jgi:hypothetical protein